MFLVATMRSSLKTERGGGHWVIYITSLQACKVGSCICLFVWGFQRLSIAHANNCWEIFFYSLLFEPTAPSVISHGDNFPYPRLLLFHNSFHSYSVCSHSRVPPLARSDIHIPYTCLPRECDCVNTSLKETPTTHVGVKCSSAWGLMTESDLAYPSFSLNIAR